MVLAFGLNLVLLAGVGLYLLNDDDYREILIWSADYFLDGRLEIDGAFSVSIGHKIELTAEAVRLKAYDGSYDLSVARLNVEQRFGSYLSTGTLWINHLNLEDLRGDIRETGNAGEFDWQAFSLPFVVIEEIQLRKLSLAYTEFDQQRHTIELSHISLDDTDNQGPVKVSAAGVINEHSLQLDGTLGSLKQLRSSNQTYPVDFILSSDTGDAGLNKHVIDLDGTVGHTASGRSQVDAIFDVNIPELVPIFNKEIVADKLGHLQGSFIVVEERGRWRIRKTQFTATGTEAYQLRVGGAAENSGQFDLHSEFGVSNPPAFGARFGIDLTGYAPFKSKGLISGNKNKLNYKGKMSIGRIESDTALTATLGRRQPQIKGKLTIAELYLADIGINQRMTVPANTLATANPDNSEQPKSEVPAPVTDTSAKADPDTSEQPKPEAQDQSSDEGQDIFDREPLDFAGLQQFNLNLDILVDEVIGEDFSINKLAGQVKLVDGVLRISPMRMTYDGGHADLELALDTRNTPSVSLKVTADELLLGGVVPHQTQEMQVTGKAQLNLVINSKGRSAHELVSGLSGELSASLVDARLPRRYVEYLSGDEPQVPTAGDAYTTLEIDAVIAAKFGNEIELTAEAVHLRANDGSYDLLLGKLNLQQNIASYLKDGDLWIDNLSLADLKVEIVEAEPGLEHDLPEVDLEEPDPSVHDWHEFDWQVDELPFILVKNMQLSNLSLIYTEGDEQDTYSLSSLVLDNDPDEEPMTLKAAGMVNELALKMEGTLGTPAQPRDRNQKYPIDISLSSGAVGATPDKPVIKLNGSIDRTQPGGSRIEAMFDVAVSELVSIFKQEITDGKLGHLQGSVDFAEVDGLWGMKKLNLTSSETDLYQLSLDGTADHSDEFEVRSQLEVPDPAAFGESFGIDLTGYAAYKGEAVLTGNRTQLNYKGQWKTGRTESDMTLAISLPGGKPLIKAKFTIPNLYLPDFGLDKYLGVDPNAPETANPHADEAQKSEEPTPVAADSQTIFDREPIDFTGLQHFNLDLEIIIDHITGVDFSIEKLEGQVKLTDGVLHVSPMRVTFESGATDLDFLLDTRTTPSFTLKLLADDVILGEIIAGVQEKVPVEGKAHLSIDINGNGYSPHEMASDLSGKLSFALEKARVPKKYVEFLTADLFGFLFRSVTFEDSYATLNCVMTGLEVDQGVAKTVLLVGDGPRLAVEGTATVDLGQETIDMVLLPKEKKRIGLDFSRITVTGSLADPDVETTGTGAATAAAVGGVILIPEIFIPVFLIEQVWRFFSSDDDTGCSDYIKEHQVEIEEFKAK
jgi:hypothetical protein